SKLINREIEKVYPTSINSLDVQDYNNIRRCIYTERRNVLLTNTPKNVNEVHAIISKLVIETSLKENFVLDNNSLTNIIIFSCNTNITFLAKCDTIFLDGTFNYATKYFCQFFTIHGVQNGHYIPLVFSLLPNKHYSSYLYILNFLTNHCQNLGIMFKPTNVVIDFEESIHKAVREAWSDEISIIGCRFHLAQAWMRKVKQLGLTTIYKDKDSEIGQFLHHLFGLTFLEPHYVGDCFAFDFEHASFNNTRVTEFLDYIVDNYIDSNSKFPPEIWASASASTQRTTNCCESFHAKWNQSFYSSHPNICQFIQILKEFQTHTYIKMNSCHLPVKIHNKSHKVRVEFLKEAVNNYKAGKLTRFNYVKAVSYHYSFLL